MEGLAIGAVFGALALYFLSRSASAITSGDAQSAVLPFLGNFASVLVGLALVIIFFRSQLLWAGCGLAAVLVLGSAVVFVLRVGRK